MPTILTHPAIPLAMALGLGRNVVSRRLLIAGMAVAVLPDLDVIGFRLGIAYASEFGHRGFSHSLLFAFSVALLGALLYHWLDSTFQRVLGFLFVSMASHSLLDAFTSGGLGVALLWPWSEQRFFAPLQVIKVSPIGLAQFFTPRGAQVIWSEIQWVWLPCVGTAVTFTLLRYFNRSARMKGAPTVPKKELKQ